MTIGQHIKAWINISQSIVCCVCRYKKPEDRGSLNAAMKHLLPLIYQRCVELGNDNSEMSLLTQKQILKVFFALIQVCVGVMHE